jgi:TonB-linked SusC/RagA family outer membrane protein
MIKSILRLKHVLCRARLRAIALIMQCMAISLLLAANVNPAHADHSLSVVQEGDITVTGTVTDVNTEPIPGVTVTVTGTTIGTTTDLNGKYALTVPGGSTLVFSFIGYQTLQIAVGGRSVIDVTLNEEVTSLDEVVVVGYGTQKKVNVIGSVSQISSSNIENRPVTQVSQALTGQMPGVTVIQRSGRPGESGGTIRVRGVGSFGATPNALVIIDGIPGNLNDINPDDIQSVSVLKDASSGAIYGARAANGVILVTTKSGRQDKLSITYNGYVGFNEATELPDFLNSWEYAEMYNIASGSNSYTQEDIEKFRSQSDPDNYPNTRFMDYLFSRKGVQTGHSLSLNGGGGAHKYFLSAGFLNQNGIIVRNNYKRYNMRVNLESSLRKNLTLNTRLSGSFEERNEPQATANKGGELTNQLIQNAIRYPAVYLGQASNGDFGIGPESGGTPVSWLQSASYLKNPVTSTGLNMRLDWTPVNGLRFSAIGGYNFALLEERSYLASQRLNDQVVHAQSYLNQSSDKQIFRTAQFLGEYTKGFSNNTLDFLIGYSFENQVSSFFNGYRQDFPSNDYTAMGMGGADNQQAGGYDAEWAIQSVFSRLKYNHNERYLFEATVRYDGSSRFPESNKYAVFPSMALGWRLSEENFLKGVTWLSDLKLKTSWGILGNQNIGNYPYQVVLNSGRNYPFGGTISTGAAYAVYKEANIRWESTETTDVGVESAFFDGRLTLNATYFNRNTSDILYRPSASVSTILGVGISETNTGEARNSGWEFDFSHRNNIGQFEYSIGGNFSIINNEVVTLGLGNVEQPNGLVGNGSTLFIGYPMEMYYGYVSDGVFLDAPDIASWATQTAVNPAPQAGDIRYKDIDGPEGVPDGKVDPTYDRTYLGSRIPKHTFGVNLGMKYKNFDFSALLQGTAGVKGYLNNYAGLAFFNLGNIQRWQMEGRFNPDNPVRYPDYPRLEVITNSGTPNTVLSDFWVVDASYVRVKNLQLGYTFPTNLISRIGMENARLYASAENLFTFHSYREGWDPEINTAGAYYPILATYTLGVNVKF